MRRFEVPEEVGCNGVTWPPQTLARHRFQVSHAWFCPSFLTLTTHAPNETAIWAIASSIPRTGASLGCTAPGHTFAPFTLSFTPSMVFGNVPSGCAHPHPIY